MGDAMQECIDNCNNCAQVCREVLEYCREKGGDTVSKTTKKFDVINWTETCEKCKHVKTDTLDLSSDKKEPEPVDPYLELDRKHFVLTKI